ncbi:hypothetical protein LJC08_00860 [Methanimicrococcus sp. OttesenSCG-928-J09]|nr:hypothetical protein [Methanimicrococcus sp. OttesenSCG-928-J09]
MGQVLVCSGRVVPISTWSQVLVLQWEGDADFHLESGFSFAVGGRCRFPLGVRV